MKEKTNKENAIIKFLENRITELEGENKTLKNDVRILNGRNLVLRTRNLQLENFIHNYKNTILVEDGSVDIEDLEKKGFCVIYYRAGATPPKILDLEYRKNETRQLEEISKD